MCVCKQYQCLKYTQLDWTVASVVYRVCLPYGIDGLLCEKCRSTYVLDRLAISAVIRNSNSCVFSSGAGSVIQSHIPRKAVTLYN